MTGERVAVDSPHSPPSDSEPPPVPQGSGTITAAKPLFLGAVPPRLPDLESQPRAVRGGAQQVVSARLRARDAGMPFRSVPQLPAQCGTCLRWLDRGRMSVMPIGAEACCALCGHLWEALAAVPSSLVSEQDEEVALLLVSRLHRLLRGAP